MDVKYYLRSLPRDIRYTNKAVRSIASGFVGLETKDQYGWFSVEDQTEEPYYVCARFGNGRHIPLPLVLEPIPKGEGAWCQYPIQAATLWLLRWTPAMQQARAACAAYKNKYGMEG